MAKLIRGKQMRILMTTVLVSALALPGCGSIRDSRMNPANWFGKSRVERVSAEPTNPLLPRKSNFKRPEAAYAGTPVHQIIDLKVERTAGGAVVKVTGLSATLGAYDVRLIPVGDDESSNTLEYTLSAIYSAKSRPNAPATSREIVAAVFVSDEALEGVRTIRVTGATNARSVRR